MMQPAAAVPPQTYYAAGAHESPGDAAVRRIVWRNPFKTEAEKHRTMSTILTKRRIADAFNAAKAERTPAACDRVNEVLQEVQAAVSSQPPQLDISDEEMKAHWKVLEHMAQGCWTDGHDGLGAYSPATAELVVTGAVGPGDLDGDGDGDGVTVVVSTKRRVNSDYVWTVATKRDCSEMGFDLDTWRSLDRLSPETRRQKMAMSKEARDRLMNDKFFMQEAWDAVGQEQMLLSSSAKPTGDHCKSFMFRPAAAVDKGDLVFKLHLDVKNTCWVMSYTNVPRPKLTRYQQAETAKTAEAVVHVPESVV